MTHIIDLIFKFYTHTHTEFGLMRKKKYKLGLIIEASKYKFGPSKYKYGPLKYKFGPMMAYKDLTLYKASTEEYIFLGNFRPQKRV